MIEERTLDGIEKHVKVQSGYGIPPPGDTVYMSAKTVLTLVEVCRQFCTIQDELIKTRRAIGSPEGTNDDWKTSDLAKRLSEQCDYLDGLRYHLVSKLDEAESDRDRNADLWYKMRNDRDRLQKELDDAVEVHRKFLEEPLHCCRRSRRAAFKEAADKLASLIVVRSDLIPGSKEMDYWEGMEAKLRSMASDDDNISFDCQRGEE